MYALSQAVSDSKGFPSLDGTFAHESLLQSHQQSVMLCLLLPSVAFRCCWLFPSYWADSPDRHSSAGLKACSCSIGALVISGASEATPEMISGSTVPKDIPKRCFPPSPLEVVGRDTLSLASLTTLETLTPVFPAALAAMPVSGSGVSNLRQAAFFAGLLFPGLVYYIWVCFHPFPDYSAHWKHFSHRFSQQYVQ